MASSRHGGARMFLLLFLIRRGGGGVHRNRGMGASALMFISNDTVKRGHIPLSTALGHVSSYPCHEGSLPNNNNSG